MQNNRKEKNQGYNKFRTIFHQVKRDKSKSPKGTKNDGEFFKHLVKEESWGF
jgi:hypothetical protein